MCDLAEAGYQVNALMMRHLDCLDALTQIVGAPEFSQTVVAFRVK